MVSIFDKVVTAINDTNSTAERSVVSLLYLYVVEMYSVVALLLLIINVIIICIVINVPKEKIRPSNYTIAHFSLVIMLLAISEYLYSPQNTYAFGYNVPALCQVLSFFRNFAYAAFPLAFVCIIYERRETFLGRGNKFLWKRTILISWIVAALESVPSLFSTKYVPNEDAEFGQCKSVPIFRSIVLAMVYYLMRFLLQHLLVVGFLCYVLYNIRSEINCFSAIPNREIRSVAKKLKFLYWYSLIFIIDWIFSGYFLFSYSLLRRTEKYNIEMETYMMLLFAWGVCYFFISPILFLWFNDDIYRMNRHSSVLYIMHKRFSGESVNTV